MDDHPPAAPARRGKLPAVVVIIAAIVAIIAAAAIPQGCHAQQSDVRTVADETAYEVERTPVRGLGLSVFDVQDAMSAATRDSRSLATHDVRVDYLGQDDRGELYEFTNSRGGNPVCMVVNVDIDLSSSAPAFPTTEVSDGKCLPS